MTPLAKRTKIRATIKSYAELKNNTLNPEHYEIFKTQVQVIKDLEKKLRN
jgi:hypothetical protein